MTTERVPTYAGRLTRGFDRVKRPLLVVSGEIDILAPPRDVFAAYERAGTSDKKYVNFGRREGYGANYGHADLVLGKDALGEVLPVVSDWLKSHDPQP